MAVALALLSSILWGIGDFAGGTATRRLPAITVVVASQAIGLVAAVIAAAALGAIGDPMGYLPWAVGAGLVGVAGLLLFYQALAVGTMGVVSPIAALGVVVPVGVGFVTGHWPPAVVGLGILLAIVGVVASSGPERSAGRSLRPVVFSTGAALCFGFTLLFIARGAEHSSLMTMVTMRVSSVTALGCIAGIAATRRRAVTRRAAMQSMSRSGRDRTGDEAHGPVAIPRPAPPTTAVRMWIVVAGLFDVSANLTFAEASTGGALAIVAILGSLYPAVTVLLARIVHGERLTTIQQVGVIVALAGVALIAGWS